MKYFRSIILLILISLLACQSQSYDESSIKQAIMKVMDDQVEGWNAFNIDKYMEGYWQSDSLRFASGGNITYGWQSTLDRYKRGYPNPETMGHLTFSDIIVTVVSAESAIVFGRYTLKRQDDEPTGLFTLLFSKMETGWKIVADHTSAAD